ncbi:MAG TPA: translocase [Rhodospirillaceae bacterium]|nr:translocase [Rhodospirillaceae bacterium]HAA92340.1 translocase [Rhodospirillaceae bacterium]HAT35098.1 translocase [Rhodospirillaceae bacterium]
MGGDYIDVIIFAAIAAFLVFRLVSVLGKRTGEEQPRDPFGMARGGDMAQGPDNPSENVVPLPGTEKPDEVTESVSPLAEALGQIQAADRTFEPGEFLNGARGAFEMVITSFALGDSNTLKALLSDAVFANFENAITQRERAGETQETTLVGIDTAEIIEANLAHTIAQVTVKFISQQISVTRNEAGDVQDGDPDLVNQVTDIWTFARDTRSKDPNWQLVETRSSN